MRGGLHCGGFDTRGRCLPPVPALPTATLSLLDLPAAGTTVAAWQGNSSGQCATGCVWVAGYRWGRGPVAAVARASNVTGGPDVVPSDAGLAVLWLEAGTTVRQVWRCAAKGGNTPCAGILKTESASVVVMDTGMCGNRAWHVQTTPKL